MNKRDFYKELMSEYMFDKEKICANAKKGRFAGRKAYPMYIGMTAAVAAVVVVAGTTIAMNLGNSGVVLVTPRAGLPDDERIKLAMEELNKNRESMEVQDHFVTFKSGGISPSMAIGVLNEYTSSTNILKLYMTDGSVISGTNEIGTVFKNNTGMIASVAIRCTGYIAARIDSDSYVLFVEPLSPEDAQDDNLKPVNVTDKEPPAITVSLPAESEPVSNNSAPNIGVPGIGDNTHTPSDIDAPNNWQDPDNTSSEPNSGSSETSHTTSEPISGGSETSGGSENTSSDVTPSQPENNENNNKNKLPEGVDLPLNAVKPSYISDDIGAQRAYFLSSDVFYVKTQSAVKLYKWNGWDKESITMLAEQNVSDAKVVWVSSNGLRLMVSGIENGARRKLYIVDAKSGTINDVPIDEMLGEEGTIAEAAYNEYSDLFVLNVLDGGTKYIFTANLTGYSPENKEIIAYGSEYMSVLAAKGSSVYYSELSGGTSAIYKSGKDGNTAVMTLDEVLVSAANPALTHAMMFGANGMSIFDPETESLIPADGVENISFGASAHSFSNGSGYFTVSSGAIVPEERLAEIAKVDFTRSFSSECTAVVSNGSVRIIPGVYTKSTLSGKLTFDVPEENASKAQREALNLGIGVINALSSGKCKECGINTAEELTAVVERCFGKTAAAELISSCNIAASGKLSYTSGSLTQINASDTVLVTDSETTAKLYIKLGMFDGKPGYIVNNVQFTMDNGKLKLTMEN